MLCFVRVAAIYRFVSFSREMRRVIKKVINLKSKTVTHNYIVTRKKNRIDTYLAEEPYTILVIRARAFYHTSHTTIAETSYEY